MLRETTYKTQLFSYFLVLFLVFAIIVGVFQYNRERDYRKKELQTMLSSYCEIVGHEQNDINDPEKDLPRLISLLRQDIRVTVIKLDGTVIFDNKTDSDSMENHINRPEIRNAMISGEGHAIRSSRTMHCNYFYYAKRFQKVIVRTALPYDIKATDLMQPDNLAFYFMGAVFALMLLFIILISDRFSKAITQLRDFSLSANSTENYKFPKGEIGQIGNRIVELYQKINDESLKVANERDKLTQHLKYSDEGIAIYSSTGENVYANARFIQIATLLTDMNEFDMIKILDQNEFRDLKTFLKNGKQETNIDFPIRYQEHISKHNVHTSLKAIIFQDLSFEVILNDITTPEQNRAFKKEMTQSIAHELKTPVAALRGYLETLSSHELHEDKRKHFIERAHLQSERLSDLVNDITIITKLEEAPQLHNLTNIDLAEIIHNCVLDLEVQSNMKEIEVICKVASELPFCGSTSLIQSIFHNLINNAIKYNDKGGRVIIDNYLVDDNFYYFSFSDNGKGVPEEHLTRIFERFYRVDDGRNRTTGGTGLGLSIVKHAVIFHGGEIIAKNHVTGGLEFLFTLRKKQ